MIIRLSLSPVQMINVLTNDCHKLFDAVLFGSFIVCTPVLFITCVVYSCFVLGYTALTGVFVYCIFIPVQVCTYCLCLFLENQSWSCVNINV